MDGMNLSEALAIKSPKRNPIDLVKAIEEKAAAKTGARGIFAIGGSAVVREADKGSNWSNDKAAGVDQARLLARKPDDNLPQETEIFFGEPYEITDIDGSYMKIKMENGDEGFIESHKHFPVEDTDKLKRDVKVVSSSALVQDDTNGNVYRIPFSSSIPNTNDLVGGKISKKFSVGDGDFKSKFTLLSGHTADIAKTKENNTIENLAKRIRNFVGSALHWGGRSPGHSDASGWLVSLFKTFGVQLPHNTGKMATAVKDKNIDSDKRIDGDLVFIGRKNGGIRHVGILAKAKDKEHLLQINGKAGFAMSPISPEGEIQGFEDHEIKQVSRPVNFFAHKKVSK